MPITSHPFLTFDFDMREVDRQTWMLLGEAMSKCQHLASSPLKPRAAQDLASVYLARGVRATTAIEGNTLSDDEVKKIVDEGSANVPESRAYLEREVQNVLGAVREIDAALRAGRRLPLDAARIRDLNHQVLDGVPDKPEVVPGEYRQHSVAVGTYRAPDWPEVPEAVDRLVTWLAEMRAQAGPEAAVRERFVAAVRAAVLAHLYIAWIHPFGNGNGRTARLVEVQILSESGIVPLVATNLLSDYYNKTRELYYLKLDEAQRDVFAFVKYAVAGFTDELRDQIAVVQRESLAIHWESWVYETFREKPSTEARDRQRVLALALSGDEWTTAEQATRLTTELAYRYGRAGERTPARDLNDLVKMGIAARTGRRYRARRELVESFRPPVAHLA
jgi:Fic family protein